MKLRKREILLTAIALVAIGGGAMIFAFTGPESQAGNPVAVHADSASVITRSEFGLALDSFNEISGEIQRNQYLGAILQKYHMDPQTIAALATNSKGVFDIRNIRAGKPYTLFCTKDSLQKACYFVYQPNPIDYVVFELRDSLMVYKGKRAVTTRKKEVAGVIQNSLFEALDKADADPALAMELSKIYAWDVDFYSIQKGDRFKVIYDQQYVQDQKVGVGRIAAAILEHGGESFYAFYYHDDSTHADGYYNEHAKSLRKAFLKAPLKFYHITSHYSMHRFHPIEHRWKSHLGTDYAAPTGTPIMSTAAGTVVASRYSRFNGNYVKVRHNSEYTTQYLHMSKRAVKVGQYVKQGQVIGYVGSTGEATGPHVCYRFWKNGKQVNPLKQKFPSANPVPASDMHLFEQMVDSEKLALADIQFNHAVLASAK
jgi:murein DD-endopeptidase MepM/ murein hydrolase activator NlpD